MIDFLRVVFVRNFGGSRCDGALQFGLDGPFIIVSRIRTQCPIDSPCVDPEHEEPGSTKCMIQALMMEYGHGNQLALSLWNQNISLHRSVVIRS
jgi:hypothetical protein